jgi:lipopolysaccharide heptosyltransferase I
MKAPGRQPERVLIIRPSALGDVCRTVPVLVTLKRRWPSARIDWLVQDSFAAAIENHPDLGRVVPFPRAGLANWWRSPAALAALKRWLGALRRERYDLVLDCQGLLRSGLFALATGAPRRIGYANAEELGWIGLNERVDAPMNEHTVDRMLRLASAATGDEAVRDLRLYTAAADREAVAADPRLSGRAFAVIAPTSRWPGKLWPAERYAHVAAALLHERVRGAPGFDAVAIVGTRHERGQIGPLLDLSRRDERVIDLVGATSIARLLAVIEASALVVANDSAAVHMAVGFGRPIVALYGPTDVARVGPYGRASSVVQVVREGDVFDHKDGARGRAMMERITVEMVLERCERSLVGGAGSGMPSARCGVRSGACEEQI